MKRILLVDDEKANVDLLTEVLRRENVEIASAQSGQEAFVYAQENSVDLVISDLVMPGIRGTDLFFKLRQIQPFVQIILVTAYPSLDDIVQMLEAGASDFIIKPINTDQLILIVKQSLAKVDRWHKLRKDLLEYKRRTR